VEDEFGNVCYVSRWELAGFYIRCVIGEWEAKTYPGSRGGYVLRSRVYHPGASISIRQLSLHWAATSADPENTNCPSRAKWCSIRLDHTYPQLDILHGQRASKLTKHPMELPCKEKDDKQLTRQRSTRQV
jgi:hypothetical protein